VKTFSLDHLGQTEFEEFCFDLLNALGATRMSWRKGTGHNASPADQGRDIECYFERKDIDGKSPEKWFVECKHYKRGVPPEELQGLLSWAAAERPDVVLIIASNFLSNPAKSNLEIFERNNKPSFKIKVWERPKLEQFTLRKPLVMRKYGLGGEFEFLNILHPAHVAYLRHPPINTLTYFFELLDKFGFGG
jgi:Restriction endonuclease